MTLRKILSILVALAVLVAPAFTRAGAAYAATPNHHAKLMDSGNCQTPPSQSGNRDKVAKDCCISMCMAVAVVPTVPAEQSELKPVPAVFAIPTIHLAYLGEIATPPPRAS